MVLKILKEWLFINYCTQIIGLWDKSDLTNGVNHLFKLQISNFLAPLIFIPYTYFNGPSGVYVYLLIIPFIITIYLLSNKYMKKIINDFDFDSTYNTISRLKRILYFALGITITVLCVLFLIFSFKILNYL